MTGRQIYKSKRAVTEEEIKELVIARIQTLPEGKKISIGSEGEFSKEELINKIREDDPIGKKFIEVELNYLQSLKNITQELINIENNE